MTHKDLLSLDETSRLLAELRRNLNRDRIDEIIRAVENGTADKDHVQRLLMEFCRSASAVRECMHEISTTPTLVEFVASRLALFLSGKEPDLMRAFGLKRPGRGRRSKATTKQRQELIAAKVMEQMHSGKTLDEAAECVGKEEGIHESTARDLYTENKPRAQMLLLCQLSFSAWPARPDPEDKEHSP